MWGSGLSRVQVLVLRVRGFRSCLGFKGVGPVYGLWLTGPV